MKKIFLILLTLLFSTSLFAEINKPGSGKINYWDDFEKWYTKQLKKAQKKETKINFLWINKCWRLGCWTKFYKRNK